MQTTKLTAGVACVAALAWSSAALGQELVGARLQSGGVSTLVIIDPATGATTPYMDVTGLPTGFELYQMAALPDCRLAGTLFQQPANSNARSRLVIIDPAAGTSEILSFTAPLDNAYVEGMDWSPRHSALLVGWGALGNFGTTRLALVNTLGQVQQTSNPLALGDIDTVVSSATLDLFFDFNRANTPRVLQLSALFPAPAVSAFASPPVLQNWFDGAIHPATGEILFTDGNGDRLVRLVGNTYVPVVTLQGGVRIRGLAWANLPARIAPLENAGVCPGGTAVISATVAGGGASRAFSWRRIVGGVPVTLTDGPTGTGSTISGAGTAALSVESASEADEGEYELLVTSAACGTTLSTRARVSICAGDWDCNGSVDFNDLLAFLNDFNGQDPRADLDGDGVIDFNDFLAFLNLYTRAC